MEYDSRMLCIYLALGTFLYAGYQFIRAFGTNIETHYDLWLRHNILGYAALIVGFLLIHWWNYWHA